MSGSESRLGSDAFSVVVEEEGDGHEGKRKEGEKGQCPLGAEALEHVASEEREGETVSEENGNTVSSRSMPTTLDSVRTLGVIARPR